MKIKIKSKLLLGVIILATFLRLWHLGSVPPHLAPDEAALGYNAYSILKTGRDEYGTFLPLVFKSFGDFKPGLYIYAAVPSILILGLNEFATRLPSVVAGIVAVFLVYLIVKEVWKKERLALFSAFILAVNPWHIYFSRGAWEVNLSLTLTLAGIYFFFKSIKGKQKYIVFSSIFFALTFLAYQGAKLSTGVVIFILAILYFRDVLRIKREYLIRAAIFGIIIVSPILLGFFRGETGRLTVFSLFSYKRPEKYVTDLLNQGGEKIGDLSYYLYHSEKLEYLRGILTRYFNHLSVKFLFFEGDWANPRHSAPNMGMFLLMDLFLMLSGAVVLVKQKLAKENIFIVLWLFLAPLPSILSRDQVHAVRSYNMVIPFVILMALALNFLVLRYRKVTVVFFVFYLLNYLYFLDAYFVHLPNHNSQLWEYGYKQIVETVSPLQNKYKAIKVQQSYAQPYIYFLFFQKYDPAKYQKTAHLVENPYGDVGQVEKLDNISFVPIDWSINRGDSGVLFAADTVGIPPEDSKDPSHFKLISEIKYLDGKTAVRILEVK